MERNNTTFQEILKSIHIMVTFNNIYNPNIVVVYYSL